MVLQQLQEKYLFKNQKVFNYLQEITLYNGGNWDGQIDNITIDNDGIRFLEI